jgi:hypothetical protein
MERLNPSKEASTDFDSGLRSPADTGVGLANFIPILSDIFTQCMQFLLQNG